MVFPDYQGGSIVNLMSSIAKARGGRTAYKELRRLPGKEIAKAKNIILINVDGLGYEWLRMYGKGSAIERSCQGSMTSTFPSTTATASTCFVTGDPAQQHGMTGWFEYVRELGEVILPLPFVTRMGYNSIDFVRPADLFNLKPFASRLKTKSFTFMPRMIAHSKFTHDTQGKAKMIPYDTFAGIARGVKVISQKPGRKYIYVYLPSYDHSSHQMGSRHRQSMQEFKRIDELFKRITQSVKDTVVILSADHGEMDVPKKCMIRLSDHPKLERTLALHLCAEPRLVYCYVRPHMKKEFERYVRTHLKHACTLKRSDVLTKQGWFGLGKPHPHLSERIGDYVLIMKGSYVLRDAILGEDRNFNAADHGGISRKEMLVPLVVARCEGLSR